VPKLPEFDKFQAPWEKNLKEGEEPTIDPASLKKFLYDVMSDREKAETERNDSRRELAETKTKLEGITREGESEAEKTARELKTAQDNAQKAEDKALDGLRWKVALDEGLTAVQAKRLVGKTEEELVEDAKALKTDLGITTKSGDDDGDDEDDLDGVTPSTKPRSLRNAGDPAKDTPNFDEDKIADDILAARSSF